MEPAVPESEDEQLKLAIAMSLEDAQSMPNGSQSGDGSKSSSLLALDRKAMEQERIARLQARQASSTSTERSMKRAIDLTEPITHNQPTPLNKANMNLSNVTKRVKHDLSPQTDSLRFGQGAVMKTWCFGFERRGNDIKIEEVLNRNDLQLAVLSSFQWDVPWVVSKLRESTKLIFVMQAKEQSMRDQYQRETADMTNLRLCFPPMPGNVNCMHSKLMLLSFPKYLRVALPTANLLSFDWGETGIMENSVFLIDLPRHSDGRVTSEADLPSFGQELVYFCRAMGLQEDIVRSIGRFDFSQTNDLALVHTIGGSHTETWNRTGYPGLGRAVTKLNLGTMGQVDVDFVVSSVGAVNEDLVRMIYLACQGDDGMMEYEGRINKTKKNARPIEPDIQAISKHFKVYFPTLETVRQSKGGPANGGTVCFQERWWESPKFPKEILHDCRSVRPGLLMHNKMMSVRHATRSDSTLRKLQKSQLGTGQADASVASIASTARPEPVSWTYVGSANFSESAWGRLSQDPTTKRPKLNCRNWECGVIFTRSRIDVSMPMQVPAARISETGSEPWFNRQG